MIPTEVFVNSRGRTFSYRSLTSEHDAKFDFATILSYKIPRNSARMKYNSKNWIKYCATKRYGIDFKQSEKILATSVLRYIRQDFLQFSTAHWRNLEPMNMYWHRLRKSSECNFEDAFCWCNNSQSRKCLIQNRH